MKYKDVRILSFIPCNRHFLRSDSLSDNEIFAGPDCLTVRSPHGFKSLQSPVGSFDVKKILKILPANQTPELVLVYADNEQRNLPKNLGALTAPKVLVLPANAQISKFSKYANEESFDFVCSENNREILPFFKNAGIQNAFWSPALSFRRYSQPVRLTPLQQIVYNGTAGDFSSYSFKCINRLHKVGIQLSMVNCNSQEASTLYSKSLISLNCSKNGEMNNNFYEVLSSGGFLLSDRLCQNSGLGLLFDNDEHLRTYSSPDELTELASFYLNEPKEAIKISRSGLKQFNKLLSFEKCSSRFLDFVFNKKIDDLFKIGSCSANVSFYESLQQIQNERPGTKVSISDSIKGGLNDQKEDFNRLNFDESRTTELLAVKVKDLEDINFKEIFQKKPFEEILVLDQTEHLSREHQNKLKKAGLKKCGQSRNNFEFKNILKTAKNLPLSIFESFVLQLDKKGKLENEPFIQLAELSLKQNKISKAELLSQKVLSRDRSCKRALEVIQKIHKKTPLDLNLISNPAGLRTGLTDYPMKILLVSNFFPPQGFGEYGRFMAALSKVLSERGHQLYVLTANQVQHGEKPVRERGIFRSLSLNGGWQDGKVFTLPEVRSRNIDSKNQAILRTHIRAFTPDVCLLGNIQFLGVSLLKEILNHQIPVIHYITGNSPAYAAKDQPLSPLYFKAVTSKNALTELHESKFSMDHTDVIIPGAMVDFYNFEKEPSFDKLKIAFIDGIQIESGLHLLINSLASLKNSGLNFTCEIAGPVVDENYLNQIKSFLIDNELIEKVKFSRGVNPAGIREVLARSNTFVYPSTETCASGISLIEAMAAGLTVISSSTGNSEEIIEDGVNGLLFSPNDNQTLTEKLLLAAKNKKLARALAKQGQFDAVNEFNITDSALKLEEDFRYLKTFCEPIFLK